MPAEMTMLADHPARQLLDFNQKLDINLLDNVVNSMHHDIGSQVRTPPQLPAKGAQIQTKLVPWVTCFFIFKATSGAGGAHQPQGPPRRLDQGGHYPGVLAEHENQSMSLTCAR